MYVTVCMLHIPYIYVYTYRIELDKLKRSYWDGTLNDGSEGQLADVGLWSG